MTQMKKLELSLPKPLRYFGHSTSMPMYDKSEVLAYVSRIAADKDAEIERLNALVLMQAEALTKIHSMPAPCSPSGIDKQIFEQWASGVLIARKAIQATSEIVSAWQSKRDNEIRVKALEYSKESVLGGVFLHDKAPAALFAKEVAAMLDRLIAELRAKGE